MKLLTNRQKIAALAVILLAAHGFSTGSEGSARVDGQFHKSAEIPFDAAPNDRVSDEIILAEASGPDFWAVTGVPAGDKLNIRSGPSSTNRILGRAGNGQVLRNLGCQGSGSSRWCKIETRDGGLRGWVSGRYLRESGGGDGYVGGGNGSDVPEIAERRSGEIEVRWASGCTVLYNSRGNRLQSGSSCSRSQRRRSDDAVARYRREQGGDDNGTGHGSMDMRGTGTVTLGGPLYGRITSKNGRSYALILTATREKFTCTGSFSKAPTGHNSMSTTIHCTNGATGSAILKDKLLTFNAGGKGGLVRFR